ncbi:MAG: FAD-dependent oxidoreductase [Pseudomonadota bacterium]
MTDTGQTDARPTNAGEVYDIIVIGSGAAGLSAALTASVEGARVLVIEKSEKLGGTSAMSGAGVWIPANHLAARAGIADSEAEALAYLHATAPEGWAEQEAPLWEAFVAAAPKTLALLDEHTPLEFRLTTEPDPMAEAEGGKSVGRMVSPLAMRRAVAGPFAKSLRRSTLPHLFTYHEVKDYGVYMHPLRAILKLSPRLARRLLTNARGQGNALVAGLVRGCLDHGVSIELGCSAQELVQDELGAVTGVIVSRGDVQVNLQAERGVVLASGGFEWNAELREQYFPGPFDRVGSPRTNTGDGHELARRAGAALARMDQANVYATVPVTYEGQPHGMPVTFHGARHAIVIDRNAERFVSEWDYNVGEAVDRRDPQTGDPMHLPCWMVGDRRFLTGALVFLWYARNQRGWLKLANTLPALAEKIDVNADALRVTINTYNADVATGRDRAFHRGESLWEQKLSGATPDDLEPALGSIERGPYFAVPLNRSILVTKGGPRTDATGQVLRPDGSRIGGLYCAGVAMANPIGTRNVGAGTTLGPCMTWGYICARSLLRTNRAET